MAFGQIYKVLEMEPLPSNKQPQKYPWCDKEGGPTCLSRLGCMEYRHMSVVVVRD